MATELFADFAATTLAAPIGDNDTTLAVADGEAFPSPANGDYFTLVLANAAETQREICLCWGRNGNTLTVDRDPLRHRAWPAGTKCELRLTAASLDALNDAIVYVEVGKDENGGRTLIFQRASGDTFEIAI